MSLSQSGERRLVVDVQRGTGGGGPVGTPAPSSTATTAAAWGPVSAVAAAASTTTARGALEASVDLEEDLLLLLSTSLGCRLGLRMVKVNEMCRYEISVESTFPTK